ncbi:MULTISPECIES: Hsp20/alpha crystallin family protein [Ralstonia]|uniref:SHSP domain-containing protein n=3 Tax=Ralstonia TaxID=48736 RepID=A0AAD2F1I4_9RALS|nr:MULTISPECIES: Hsp20/alpha crystallin family protein [Ralstonia]MEA3268640.1 Hsp20/alpha crystallin family protein [Pseudomonadota bacterium]ENZ78923.1 molecular chaperone (small heat shock protein) [Ralstonia pickettii OR214]MBL4778647.1 Hsp20/alpha crystallin family protein [Ralstonia sp.]MBT2178453.1 Hsp20/alpha crystallin family protein [Ralstonia pickettii]MCM3581213.1 Hsp20/alpha crystallin family protein [Ralstonia pickettii]
MNDTAQLATQAQPGRATVAKQPAEQPAARQTHLAPPVDIFENRQGITLFADLPGVPREKLDIRVQDGTLTVDAELMVPTPSGLRLQHGEVRHPHFSRTFVLSPDFDASRIDAQLRDGVLKLTIPRRDEAKPRRIEVHAG